MTTAVASTPAAVGRHRRRRAIARADLLTIALMIATVGAALLWTALQRSMLALEWPLYALVWVVLAAWLPHIAWGIDSAWRADVAACAFGIGSAAHQDGYGDGFIDCAMLKG